MSNRSIGWRWFVRLALLCYVLSFLPGAFRSDDWNYRQETGPAILGSWLTWWHVNSSRWGLRGWGWPTSFTARIACLAFAANFLFLASLLLILWQGYRPSRNKAIAGAAGIGASIASGFAATYYLKHDTGVRLDGIACLWFIATACLLHAWLQAFAELPSASCRFQVITADLPSPRLTRPCIQVRWWIRATPLLVLVISVFAYRYARVPHPVVPIQARWVTMGQPY